MAMNRGRLLVFGGWSGSFILATAFLVLEAGSLLLGGDWGGFLFVTFHFVVLPVLSVVVLAVTVLKVRALQEWVSRLVTVASLVVPVTLLYLSVTGSPVVIDLFDKFGIRFSR